MLKPTHTRINITLPKDTIRLIDRVVDKGERSHFLNEAVEYYVREMGKNKLRKLIKEGATERAERDLMISQEWFSLEHEAWQKGDKR